ncbi:hypothetical protein [Streptomyces chartreusis]|uniref:hypothetical protein n=1 Tax=Streptomyces chartreusis TaxID=1969 RepID=UPI0037F181C8
MWESAAVDLVMVVVDRTGSGDAWYEHSRQVLTWFLTRWGIDDTRAQVLVKEAIGGRFESWVAPEHQVVQDVAERLALSIEQADGV